MASDDDIFAEALALPAAARAEFIARACAGDDARRVNIAELLAHTAATHGFLEKPFAPRVTCEPLHEEKPREVIGRYQLLERIGEGGCGVVWLAGQTEPVRRQVALKVIKPGMDTKEVIARFEAERQALALMDHPHIAKVFDAGTTNSGRPYFVMEFVRGTPITRFCDEANLTTAARLLLFIQVCHSIQHAHQKGIIHRDIKPSNILVERRDEVAVPKVIDFGIAKATQGRLTDSTVFTSFAQLIGTPAYMSPEQADLSSVDIDTRSDIYSLGALLYELLTGQPPFEAKSLASAGLEEIRRQIREVEPPKPSTRFSTQSDEIRATIAKLRGTPPAQLSLLLRGDLDWIVMRCLEKDRARRYETANAVATDLRRHLAHEPVAARPPSTGYVLGKLVRRHRFGFAAAAAISVVLVTGALVSTWLAIRATHAEREQSRMRETAQRAQAAESQQRQRAETQELAARRRAYASDLNALQAAFAADNLGRAQELLDRQRPKPGEIDLRDWEWRYLWQVCRSEAQAVLKEADDNSVASLSASADGKWLAVGGVHDGRLSVLNLQTKEKFPVPAGAGVVHVAFSPREPLLAIGIDGIAPRQRGLSREPVEAGGGCRVLLWDANIREIVGEISLTGACYGLFFSSDGQVLAVADFGRESAISLWRVADASNVASWPAGRPFFALNTGFATTPDLTLAVTYDRPSGVSVIDLKTGEKRALLTHAGNGLALSPDGSILASTSNNTVGHYTIHLWEVASGREIGRLAGHSGRIDQLVFLPDGKHLVSASADQTLRLWDLGTRTAVRTFRGHQTEVWKVTLTPDQRTLVSGSKDGSVCSWDLQAALQSTAAGTIPRVNGAWAFAGGGEFIVEVDNDGRVTRRQGARFQEEIPLLQLGPITELTDYPTPVTFDSQRPLLAALTRDKVQVWDWERRVLVREFAGLVRSQHAVPLQFTNDGTKLAVRLWSAREQFSYREWEIATGRETRSFDFTLTPDSTRWAAFSPDGTKVTTVTSPSGEGRLLNLQSGETAPLELKVSLPSGLPGFSPDGRLLVVPSHRSNVRIFDVTANQEVAALRGYMYGVHSAAFSPDGKRVVSGGTWSEAIAVWDTLSHERLLTVPASSSSLTSVAFSPDGNVLVGHGILASGASTRSLHFWRAPSWAEIAAAEQTAGR